MENKLNLSRNRLDESTRAFVICAVALLFCPFFNMSLIGDGYIGDAMIQIRIGLDMIARHGILPGDIYSWHQGLNWVQQELGWYFLDGLFYKIGGIGGVIFLTAIFNYTMAGIIVYKSIKDFHVNPYIVILTACIARVYSFPNYNSRPHLPSQLVFVLFMYIMMDEKIRLRRRLLAFPILMFFLAWFHGGMVSLFFVMYGVFVVIELVNRNFREIPMHLGSMAAGFVTSLLTPNGIHLWTYAVLQAGGEGDIWSNNMEWAPKTFAVWEITGILIFIVGFAVDERVRKFDKKTITRLCFFFMFLIISCKYGRFMNYTALVMFMFGAEELQVLLLWLNDNIFRIDLNKLKLGSIANGILCVFCVGFMLFTTVFSWIRFFPTNTASDISAIAGYDEEVIRILKDKNYDRIYNSFNTGTWLAFYGIPVHIDNRTDLYMEEFSGVDYIRGKMTIVDIDTMNEFVDEYDVDALVLDLIPGTTHDWFADDLYQSDRYSIVYDNIYTSVYDPEVSYRWMIVEVVR